MTPAAVRVLAALTVSAALTEGTPLLPLFLSWLSPLLLPITMATEVKLFNRWSFEDVEVKDIALIDYVAVKQKYAVFLPHTAGRYNAKRFRKSQCPIVERLVCSLMMKGRNNGKKLMATRIVKHTFEIIHLLNGENPVQVRGGVQPGGRKERAVPGIWRGRARVEPWPLHARVALSVWARAAGGAPAASRDVGNARVCTLLAQHWVCRAGGRGPFGSPSGPHRGLGWAPWVCRRGRHGWLERAYNDGCALWSARWRSGCKQHPVFSGRGGREAAAEVCRRVSKLRPSGAAGCVW